MGYIRKAVQEKLYLMDQTNYLPEKWDQFIDEVKLNYGLIIKGKKNHCRCSNCGFEFISKKRIKQYAKCPNCKNEYQIRSSRLQREYFIDRLILLDKISDELVFRYFEIYLSCRKDNNYKFKESVVEFARTFPEERTEVVNERLSICQCNIHVCHWRSKGKWRQYTRNYDFGNKGYVYPYNLKEVLKDTDYKYLDLEEFVKKSGPLRFEYLMRNIASLPSFEVLIKLKLYKLARSAYDISVSGNSFNRIFGVPKDYYNFMKKNNISYEELKILRLVKEKNIRKVRFLARFNHYGDVKELSEYISFNYIYEYLRKYKENAKLYIYKDYLRFAKLLGLDLKNRKYVFPDNLRKKHDELEKAYEVHNKKILNGLIKNRLNELNKNIYQDKKFIIIPAESVEALENESKQQSNCVRTYSEKYAEANCDIYFMRLLKNRKKSLVTVEVRNNKVIQSRTRFNNSPEEIQLEFLKKWQETVLQQSCRV